MKKTVILIGLFFIIGSQTSFARNHQNDDSGDWGREPPTRIGREAGAVSDSARGTCGSLGASAAADNEKLRSYEAQLLDMSQSPDLQGITKATALYRDKFLKDPQNAEAACRITLEYLVKINSKIQIHGDPAFQKALGEMHACVRADTGRYLNTFRNNIINEFENLKSEKAFEIRTRYSKELRELREINRHGVRFYTGEGDWYGTPDDAYVINSLLSEINFDLKEYLKLMRWEEEHEYRPMFHDGALARPWEALRASIIRWEEFASRYSALLETQTKVAPDIKGMLGVYVLGIDNTPVFKAGSHELKHEVVESYQNYIRLNTSSKYHQLIKKLYEIYSRNKFKINIEAARYLENEGFEVPYSWYRHLGLKKRETASQ